MSPGGASQFSERLYHVSQVLLDSGLGDGGPHLLGLVVGEAAAIPLDGVSLPKVDVVDGAGTDNCPCLT